MGTWHDSSALAKESYTAKIEDIGKSFFFPDGMLFFHKSYSQRQLLSHGASCSSTLSPKRSSFLAPGVFYALLADMEFKTHLSKTDFNTVNHIKQDDLNNHTILIIQHGYTGPITEDNVDAIINILSRIP